MLTRARDNIAWPTIAVLVLLALLPAIVTGATSQSILIQAMIYAVGAVGLDVLTGYSGQFSFGQFVYFAVGAYLMAGLQVHARWPWEFALLAAVAGSGLLAAVLSSAMVRLRFFGSSVGTFFMGAVAVDILSGNRLARWSGGSSGTAAPGISLGGTALNRGLGLYFFALLALAGGALLCVRYTRVRAGLAARVIKQNEIVAAVLGIRVVREKIRAQVIAGMVAGLGGCVLAQNLGYLSPDTFGVNQSIELFAIVAVGGAGSIAGPIIGAVFFFEVINGLSTSGSSSELSFALILLAVVVFLNRGLYDLVERLVRASRLAASPRTPSQIKTLHPARASRSEGDPADVGVPSEPQVDGAGVVADAQSRDTRSPTNLQTARTARVGSEELLTVEGLGVHFGGVAALGDVDVTVRRGDVHAIIGPNGAGKTTLLNCISGIQAYQGRIRFDGEDLAQLSVSHRRQRGIARTFQHPSLVSDLDVIRNVSVGAYETHSSSVIAELLSLPAPIKRQRAAQQRAVVALGKLQFPSTRWRVPAGDLTMGEQKHVDIARAMSGEPKLLLLDEPTAGLGAEEVAAVATAIEAIRDAGVTIVVIAHHVGFVRQIADRCTVLDFGRVLMTGTPDEVLESPAVVEVFVGTGTRS